MIAFPNYLDRLNRSVTTPHSLTIRRSRIVGKPFFHTDPVAWEPRFSFAWQPLGVSHNTVVRGGFGLFYELFSGGFGPSFSDNPPLVNRVTRIWPLQSRSGRNQQPL